ETTVIGISFMKKTKYTIWIAIISALTNVVGNIILVPILGAKGAAISTGISYIVFFITRTIISKKLYDVDYKMFKILLCVGIVSGLALYSSFSKFDLVTLVLGIGAIISIGVLYKNILLLAYKQLGPKVPRTNPGQVQEENVK
ncbi:MAG: polysaccharide biosynthesis C-terminal domain-containing protein, partial [Sarcina sp.]